ncbi:MAG: hypothetical protein ACXADW_06550 [Candidatus Hodarchaeales archaeon]|jgi:hypothetical protein
MIAKGFAIQKVLKDGKLVNEQGIMGEFNDKDGAKIVEVSDGKAKYTELTPSDIMKLISRPASSESLEHRIASLTRKHHRHHRHHHRHHSRGVASGHHTKRHRRTRKRRKNKRRKTRRRHKKKKSRKSKRRR